MGPQQRNKSRTPQTGSNSRLGVQKGKEQEHGGKRQGKGDYIIKMEWGNVPATAAGNQYDSNRPLEKYGKNVEKYKGV